MRGLSIMISIKCYAGSYDKLVAKYLKKIASGKALDRHEQFTLAFAAVQIGNMKVYEVALQAVYAENIGDESDQNRQIQRMLALSKMQKAIQLSNRYGRAEDTFKLLCLSYDNQTAHQFVQVAKVINPDGIKPAEVAAKKYFTTLNHRYAKAYDSSWKPRSLKREYKSPAEEIKLAMDAGGKIHGSSLSPLEVSAEDKELELKIVNYLIDGHFKASAAERRLLEKHDKLEFLSDYYFAKWQEKNIGK